MKQQLVCKRKVNVLHGHRGKNIPYDLYIHGEYLDQLKRHSEIEVQWDPDSRGIPRREKVYPRDTVNEITRVIVFANMTV